ncbi:MAG: BT_3044 domain-containing protein [Candidatus Saccharimonadaceae bacterium]
MKKTIKIACLTLLAVAFVTCDTYDFEQEQYKNEVNLLSNTNMVYDRQVADLNSKGDTLYMIAGLSGSQKSTELFKVAVMESDSLFNAFNKSNFDIELHRYAKFLPAECFTFPNTEMTIPAGDSKVKFPIYLQNLDKLSPDTIYFLNYKIDSLKTPFYNNDKKEVLVRIYKENEFATTQKNTFYNYTSSYVITPGTPVITRRPTNANQVFPLGQDSIRMIAGDENMGEYKSALKKINDMSITVVVGDKTAQNPLARGVIIESYRNIDVVQLTPLGVYNNTFLINIISTPDGRKTYYKEFRLHYKYRLASTSPYKEVKAILRMEFNPRANEL